MSVYICGGFASTAAHAVCVGENGRRYCGFFFCRWVRPHSPPGSRSKILKSCPCSLCSSIMSLDAGAGAAGARHRGASVALASAPEPAGQSRRTLREARRIVAPPAGDPVRGDFHHAPPSYPTTGAPAWAPSLFPAAASQPQRECPDRCGGSRHSQGHVMGTWGGGASDLRLHLLWRALVWCSPPISTDSATGAESALRRHCVSRSTRGRVVAAVPGTVRVP